VSGYLTATEVAAQLGLSPSTITAYRARGKMPAPDIQYGRTPLWTPETIRKWRGAQARATTPA
jgi:DNA-binding transcriptional MerR regulator